MIWFSADSHFGHFNIIRYCNRPFTTVGEMEDVLVDKWNSVVSKDDDVFHLGDFTLRGIDEVERLLRRLNGHNIYFIPGGHDENWIKHFSAMPTRTGGLAMLMPPLITIAPKEIQEPNAHEKVIVLCHYAMRVWDRSHYGSWMLFGHSHGMLRDVVANSMDVGVDCWDYAPVSLDTISSRLKGNAYAKTPRFD